MCVYVWCTDIRETLVTVYVWCACNVWCTDIRETLVTVYVSCACMSGVQTLERHLRLCPVTVRRPRVFTSHMTSAIRHRDILLRSTLKSAIKSAVYRIVVTFHEHLKYIHFTA